MIITLVADRGPRAHPGNPAKADGLSATTAATSTRSIMTRLIVGVPRGASIRTETLAVSLHSSRTACFAVAAWASTFQNCCHQETLTSAIVLMANGDSATCAQPKVTQLNRANDNDYRLIH